MENHELMKIQDLILAFQSKDINELIGAWAKARLEYQQPKKDKVVRFSGREYEYASLKAIIECCANPLAKNGIIFSQLPRKIDGEIVLVSKIMHSSGQWISSTLPINPADKTQQGFGSSLSYQRRYAAMAILGLAPEDDIADDDGIHADKPQKPYTIEPKPIIIHEKILPEQVEELEMELEGFSELYLAIKKTYGIDSLEDIKKSSYLNLIKQIRDHKMKLADIKK